MIISVHLADVGLRGMATSLHRPPRTGSGLRWCAATGLLAIGHIPPRPLPGRVGLIGAWDDDEALDAFLQQPGWGTLVRNGYEARFRVLRSYGHWAALPELESARDPGLPEEPVGVLTLGRLKLSRAVPFFRASARAERPLLSQPGLLAAVGLARPPFLSTFSLWRTSKDMQKYAHGTPGSGHASATSEHKVTPFHHESIFLRLRPYQSTGHWNGGDPLDAVQLRPAPSFASQQARPGQFGSH